VRSPFAVKLFYEYSTRQYDKESRLAAHLIASREFGLRRARKQIRDCFLDGDPFRKHRIDGRRDRHVYLLGVGEIDKHAAGVRAFAKAASRYGVHERQPPPNATPRA